MIGAVGQRTALVTLRHDECARYLGERQQVVTGRGVLGVEVPALDEEGVGAGSQRGHIEVRGLGAERDSTGDAARGKELNPRSEGRVDGSDLANTDHNGVADGRCQCPPVNLVRRDGASVILTIGERALHRSLRSRDSGHHH
jgi:hypothetical protein